ncbi:hypothetical protein M1525_00585 [Patescibacteria group bacterium]|nr:hypothetical protein [Patescibacteria group bacterium]
MNRKIGFGSISAKNNLTASFTLVETLIVLAIIATLVSILIFVIKPGLLTIKAQDSTRIGTVNSLAASIRTAYIDNPSISLGATDTIYLSLTDNSATCSTWIGSNQLPLLPAGWSYHCAPASSVNLADGTGWLPINFATDSNIQLSTIQTDSTNNQIYYYSYTTNGNKDNFQLTACLADSSNRGNNSLSAKDGGPNNNLYEIGTNLFINPPMFEIARGGVCDTGNWTSWRNQSVGWAKTYLSYPASNYFPIEQTNDGGYIVGGSAYTSSSLSTSTTLVLKLNSQGQIQWQNAYNNSGGSSYINSIIQTFDNGYLVVGLYGLTPWVFKLDSQGQIQWQETIGAAGKSNLNAVVQTSDGGYVVAGSVSNGSNNNFWILKLNSQGQIQWQNVYNDSNYDGANSIVQTSDGGYIVAGDLANHAWVLKLDSSGNIQWQEVFNKSSIYSDGANSIVQTSDGGYVVAGYTFSFGAGNDDYWVLKLDSSGNIQWQKAFGGANYDSAYSVIQTSDGGYVVAGSTNSFGAGNDDYWVLKLDSSGNIQWQKAFGGSNNDDVSHINNIAQTSDSGYIVGGQTASFGIGGIWTLKLDSSGNITFNGSSGATLTNTKATTTITTAPVANTTSTVSITSYSTTQTTIVASTTNIQILQQAP